MPIIERWSLDAESPTFAKIIYSPGVFEDLWFANALKGIISRDRKHRPTKLWVDKSPTGLLPPFPKWREGSRYMRFVHLFAKMIGEGVQVRSWETAKKSRLSLERPARVVLAISDIVRAKAVTIDMLCMNVTHKVHIDRILATITVSLASGKVVDLGEFGSFTIESDGREPKVRFTPGTGLVAAIKRLHKE